MEVIKFNRYKKKSLILLHEVLDDTLIKKIKNRKILQTLQTFILKNGIVEEKTLALFDITCVVKINKNKIVCGSFDKLKIWNVITGNCIKTLEGDSEFVMRLIKINENKIASCSRNNKTVKIWDVISGICLKTLEGHLTPVSCLVNISANLIASGGVDFSNIKLWDVLTGNCLRTLEGYSRFIYCLVKINKNKIASSSMDKTIKIWDVITDLP